jgi:hypothetical protein
MQYDLLEAAKDQDKEFNIDDLCDHLNNLPIEEKITQLNAIREKLHKISPFKSEPVDFVKWVINSKVKANDYNPNSVAPPEMELLRTSIDADGYTQPIVANEEGDDIVVVDGFHRHRVGKECKEITARVKGYLPVVQIRAEQVDREHRMASTVRHNRARGKHKVEAMSDMVIELKRRNWTNSRICKELGMDEDEVLRLCQITGLQEIFADGEFSKAWEAEGFISEDDFEDLKGHVDDYQDDDTEFRTVNTSDEKRVFHTFDKWECHKAGFYATKPPEGMRKEDCHQAFANLLKDTERFDKALRGVVTEWENSCEHYLTNEAMNRLAWLGQAAVCYETGVSSEFRGGWQLLTQEEQNAADEIALKYLNEYLKYRGMNELTMNEAKTTRQSDIY